MITKKIAPKKDLYPYISAFSIQKIDSESRQLHFPNGRYALPDTIIRIAFHFTGSVPWVETTDAGYISQPAFNARGYQARPFVFNTDSEVNVLTVEFTPYGFYNLFGIPASELGSSCIDLKDLIKKDLAQIEDRLFDCRTYQQKVDFLHYYLRSKIQNDFETKRAYQVHQIVKKNPKISVRRLAETTFMSERTLHRFFKKYFGLSPKKYLRLHRFEKAISLMNDKYPASLTEIACQTGYFDQAHFTNEIKSFSGKAPSEVIAML